MVASNSIIRANPQANPIVPMLLCFPFCDDGISSSMTTYSIAPAAKASNAGIAAAVSSKNITVAIAATGSTSPDSVPIKNALARLFPSLCRGIDMMAPSGMFCTAIPMDNASAAATVSVALPSLTPASTTPTAIPSGMLCSATASIILVERGNAERTPSGCSLSMCWCGINVSSASRNPIPTRKPAITGHVWAMPLPPLCSSAGCNSDQKAAATIMPDAKPSIHLFAMSDIRSRTRNTIAAPKVVPKKGSVSIVKNSI